MTEPANPIPLRQPLPRNLTARADYLVAGNPMNARPESGVGNAHPGLEFDVRALDRHFFPGLVFDFQYGAGAKLVEIGGDLLSGTGLAEADLVGLFLWSVSGRFGDSPDKPQIRRLVNVDGYMVLRSIMDLELGEIAVLVGRLPQTAAEIDDVEQALARTEAVNGVAVCKRDGGVYVRFEGERARFLTDDGVLDPDLLPPGEITRNLCSPWQWDFADCHCYYWASSKPDLVIGMSGEAQVLNFQRDRDRHEPARPANEPDAWRSGVITQPGMFTAWEQLPVVTAEREGAVPRIPRWPPADPALLMSLDQIAVELPKLAAIEHALCIEYLYGRYSIRAPRRAPSMVRRAQTRRYRAAHEILNIAVDEMRHFRWVNEFLVLLKREPCLQRARVIRPDIRRLFELRPLVPRVLDDFIGVEAPSAVFSNDPRQLDGLYTRILVSLHHLEDRLAPGVARRLMQLVKVIIDEGQNHYERFRRIKDHLTVEAPEAYLNFKEPPAAAAGGPWGILEQLCDRYYDLLLHALYITFRLGRHSRGTWLGLAHEAMFVLDESAYLLVENRLAPCFQVPDWVDRYAPPLFEHRFLTKQWPARLQDMIASESVIDRIFAPVLADLDRIVAMVPGRARRILVRHRATIVGMQRRVAKEFRNEQSPGNQRLP